MREDEAKQMRNIAMASLKGTAKLVHFEYFTGSVLFCPQIFSIYIRPFLKKLCSVFFVETIVYTLAVAQTKVSFTLEIQYPKSKNTKHTFSFHHYISSLHFQRDSSLLQTILVMLEHICGSKLGQRKKEIFDSYSTMDSAALSSRCVDTPNPIDGDTAFVLFQN